MDYDFKYADLMNDDVFKLVFGQESSKDVMIEFLNQVINDRQITDLEFFDKEMQPTERRNKTSVYDMFCKTDDGSRIIVEVQRRKQQFFPERALYYSTFQIQRQVEAGAKEYDFLPVYVISLLEFGLDRNVGSPDVKTVYRLYEENSHELLTDRLTMIFIELNKFNKRQEELDGNILEGMYFCFKHMAHLNGQPEALRHKVFRKIFEVSELYNMDEETRNKVLEKMTTERDLRNQMAYARKEAIEEGHAEGLAKGLAEGRAEGMAQGRAEGMAQGRAEGRAEGEKAKALEIAARLIENGMTKEEAADLTGIPVEDLK